MPRPRLTDASEERIGAAECAARTGLSRRALRVYEQQKLIAPSRSASGWRQYVAADLSRLNTIRVLKGLGLSLSQIRKVLTSRSPSLEEILQVQAVAWTSRKRAAEKAIELVDRALTHLKHHKALSMDALCELVRMYGLNPVVPHQDELISRDFPPRESQLWACWWAEHPNELAESARFSEAQLDLFKQLKSLLDSGRDAACHRAQGLMRKWEALFLSHHIRDRTVRQLAWNYEVTFKWFELVHKNRIADYSSLSPAGDGLYTPRFATYLGEAYQKSAHGQALAALQRQIAAAIAAGIGPGSAKGRAMAQRFATLCKTHALGEPAIYARFASFIEQVNHGPGAPGSAAAWVYLVDALAALPRTRIAAAALPGARCTGR